METQRYSTMQALAKAIETGKWRDTDIIEYVHVKNELSVLNGTIQRGHRLVILRRKTKRLN